MIINPIKCEKCGEDMQPDDIGIGSKNDELIRICLHCGNEVAIR